MGNDGVAIPTDRRRLKRQTTVTPSATAAAAAPSQPPLTAPSRAVVTQHPNRRAAAGATQLPARGTPTLGPPSFLRSPRQIEVSACTPGRVGRQPADAAVVQPPPAGDH